MQRDILWGAGGGLLMISLGHVARWSGVIGAMQAAPLIAGGAVLMLLTGILVIVRLYPATAPRTSEEMSTGPSTSLAMPVEPVEEAGWASPAPGAPCVEVEPQERRSVPVAIAAPPLADHNQGATGDAIEEQTAVDAPGTSMMARQVRFRFSAGDQELAFCMPVDGAHPDLIAAKAVKIARELMRRSGVADRQLYQLAVTGAELDPSDMHDGGGELNLQDPVFATDATELLALSGRSAA
jgi:hypothetical protein